jgi:hypothetical protein
MSDKFTAPKVEKRVTAVNEQIAQEAEMDNSMKVLTQKGPTDVVDIYKEGIDNFRNFLAGNFSGDLEARKEFQRNFMRTIWAILELDDVKVKAILDYFVTSIVEAPALFNYDKILAPLFTLESSLPAEEVTRYKRFMLFIVMYSENARDKRRFLENYDMVKFENMFNPVAKQRLHNYVYG